MSETLIVKQILLATSKAGYRLFRNNVGVGWAGKIIKKTRDHIWLHMARPLRAGLCEGSSDTIGWHSVTITEKMVGKKVAVFTAIEVKTPTKGRVSESQQSFINIVNLHGGCAFTACSVGDALEGIKQWQSILEDSQSSF